MTPRNRQISVTLWAPVFWEANGGISYLGHCDKTVERRLKQNRHSIGTRRASKVKVPAESHFHLNQGCLSLSFKRASALIFSDFKATEACHGNSILWAHISPIYSDAIPLQARVSTHAFWGTGVQSSPSSERLQDDFVNAPGVPGVPAPLLSWFTIFNFLLRSPSVSTWAKTFTGSAWGTRTAGSGKMAQF